MKLENQVCSLKPAKKLKKLGVKQESLFVWWKSRVDNTWQLLWSAIISEDKKTHKKLPEYCSAFTVAELGERLANAFRQLSGTLINEPRGYFKRLWIKLTGFDNEAENRAKMLIYLIENKLLK